VTNDGRTTIDTVELLSDCKTYFRSKIQFFQFKLISEHALGLCSDLKPFVRGQVDGHVFKDLNKLEIEISKVNGTMEQPVQSTNI